MGTPEILAVRKRRFHEVHEVEASLGYKTRPCLKKIKYWKHRPAVEFLSSRYNALGSFTLFETVILFGVETYS